MKPHGLKRSALLRRGEYLACPKDILSTRHIAPGGKLVLMVLINYLFEENVEAWPGLDTIVRETGLTRRGVTKILEILENDGHISRDRTEGGQSHSTRYRIHPSIPPELGTEFPVKQGTKFPVQASVNREQSSSELGTKFPRNREQSSHDLPYIPTVGNTVVTAVLKNEPTTATTALTAWGFSDAEIETVRGIAVARKCTDTGWMNLLAECIYIADRRTGKRPGGPVKSLGAYLHKSEYRATETDLAAVKCELLALEPDVPLPMDVVPRPPAPTGTSRPVPKLEDFMALGMPEGKARARLAEVTARQQ